MRHSAGRRSEEERWQRALELGAVVEIGRTIEEDGREIEIVRTLADCIQTTLIYRGPRMISPHAFWPPEIAHGASAHGGEDFAVAEFEPVLPERTSIVVAFRSGFEDRFEGQPVTIPVDRRRSAAVERYLADPRPPAAETDGVRLEVMDARVGVMSGIVELMVTTDDPSIIVTEIGWSWSHLHHLAGPGLESLWRDWHPRQAEVRQQRRRGPGGMTTVSMSTGFTATARRSSERRPGPPADEPPPDPAAPVNVVAVPGRESLGGGGHAAGVPMLRAPRSIVNISFDPMPNDATGVEVALSGLYVFRFGGGRVVTVPNPRPDAAVDLTGTVLEGEHGGVELLRWEPGPSGSPTLFIRPRSPGWYPDVRVIHGDESVSLWAHLGPAGTVGAGLPRMYDPAFNDPKGVRLALRMLGRPAPEVRIPLRLTMPGRR